MLTVSPSSAFSTYHSYVIQEADILGDRVAIMSRRAENMRWEALKVVSRRGEEERGALLLQEAYRADANASKPGGEALVRRAARRATRLTALAARPAKDPLPSTLAGGKGGRGRREKSETQDAPAPP